MEWLKRVEALRVWWRAPNEFVCTADFSHLGADL